MKYLALFEVDPEDLKQVTEKHAEFMSIREKSPEKVTKQIFPDHLFVGENNPFKGFAVVEAEPE